MYFRGSCKSNHTSHDPPPSHFEVSTHSQVPQKLVSTYYHSLNENDSYLDLAGVEVCVGATEDNFAVSPTWCILGYHLTIIVHNITTIVQAVDNFEKC